MPRLRKQRVPEDAKIAKLIDLPMYRPGEFEAIDIANHSEADQRKMVRSGERRTIRRTPKLATEPIRKLLSVREIKACEWYASAHAARYDTVGITANYAATGTCGRSNFDHLPKTREQQEALEHFDYARAGISPSVLGLFENVVLHGGPLGRRALAFKVAVEQLLSRIEARVEL